MDGRDAVSLFTSIAPPRGVPCPGSVVSVQATSATEDTNNVANDPISSATPGFTGGMLAGQR
ncbi:hypothetical protein EV193_103312 [Herbihabitans rhizosphaerae]|uniref:Uncharacterized protein n=1 Tax=Herbihabitans rhizosphaerae TaxID=1872711 RepID=A0A4Q7KW68_9PSEU|nr:hypothetical protein EV193_103312 [Herbihabitans rhizosphaerae]